MISHLAFPGIKFLGYGTFSFRTRKVPGKQTGMNGSAWSQEKLMDLLQLVLIKVGWLAHPSESPGEAGSDEGVSGSLSSLPYPVWFSSLTGLMRRLQTSKVTLPFQVAQKVSGSHTS